MLFGYSLRSMMGRPGSTGSMVVALSLTFGTVLTLLGVLDGMHGVLEHTGSTENAAVVSSNSTSELDSVLDQALIGPIKVGRGVAQKGTAQVSIERLFNLRCRQVGTGQMELVLMRGIDPAGLAVHGTVELVEGRWPTTGERGVVVGARLVGRVDGARVGEALRVSRNKWPVVGVFRAPGTIFESEAWADRTALNSELGSNEFNVASARLESPDRLADFAASISADRANKISVVSEPALYARRLASLSGYAHAIELTTIVLGIGAAIACANTVYSSFVSRQREFATLLAMGFTRGALLLLVARESLLIALGSAFLGIALVSPLSGTQVALSGQMLLFGLRFSSFTIGVTMAGAVVVGIGVAISSMIRISRLDILESLRDS